jgi:hypothetical protein
MAALKIKSNSLMSSNPTRPLSSLNNHSRSLEHKNCFDTAVASLLVVARTRAPRGW